MLPITNDDYLNRQGSGQVSNMGILDHGHYHRGTIACQRELIDCRLTAAAKPVDFTEDESVDDPTLIQGREQTIDPGILFRFRMPMPVGVSDGIQLPRAPIRKVERIGSVEVPRYARTVFAILLLN